MGYMESYYSIYLRVTIGCSFPIQQTKISDTDVKAITKAAGKQQQESHDRGIMAMKERFHYITIILTTFHQPSISSSCKQQALND